MACVNWFCRTRNLRRREAELRVSEANQLCAAAQADATLGRYMVEMRTNVNNALTAVLGNAELMVLEPGLPANVLAEADTIRNMALGRAAAVLGNAELMVLEPGLPANVLAEADTIRNMALRLHEVFQRFSSLEKELTVTARESGKKSLHAAAGRS